MLKTKTLQIAALLVSLSAVAACNAITGAGALELDAAIKDSATAGSGVGGSNSSSGATGTSEEVAASSTSNGVVGSAVGSGGTTSTSSVAASSTAASSGAGGSLAWPAGPYGVAPGMTLPENLSWAGYAEGTNKAGTIALKNWYDPSGSKGVDAILVITSQFGCGPCAEEAQTLQGHTVAWKSQGYGIKVLQLVVNDSNGNSPDASAASEWKNQFGLVDIAVGADPNDAMAPGGSYGTPLQTLINPRTMKVISVVEGFSGSFSDAESLAASNQ